MQSGQARVAEVPDVLKECEEIFTLAHEGVCSSELIPDGFSPVQVKRRSYGVANDVFPFDAQGVRRRERRRRSSPFVFAAWYRSRLIRVKRLAS